MDATACDVIDFWTQAGPARWFAHDAAFDAQCGRFLDAHLAASRGELDAWGGDAGGALAVVLLLDQIPRNVFRGSAHAFATDGLARRHAQAAIDTGFDTRVDPALRLFFYLPFEHSESMDDQHRAVALIDALGNAELLRYAQLHRDLISRFGRFPHRNASLGRESTQAERDYLAEGGFSG